MTNDQVAVFLKESIRLQCQINHLARLIGLSENELTQMFDGADLKSEAEFLALRHRMGDL